MYLVDSVILIDHLNRISQASDWLLHNGKRVHISLVTRAEVLTAYSGEEFSTVQQLLDLFQMLVITPQVADLAAQLRRQYRWKLPDAFQASLAQCYDLMLVTRNTKDFDPDRFSFVLVPYRL